MGKLLLTVVILTIFNLSHVTSDRPLGNYMNTIMAQVHAIEGTLGTTMPNIMDDMVILGRRLTRLVKCAVGALRYYVKDIKVANEEEDDDDQNPDEQNEKTRIQIFYDMIDMVDACPNMDMQKEREASEGRQTRRHFEDKTIMREASKGTGKGTVGHYAQATDEIDYTEWC
ncbi:hypothetical protein HDE_09203 [Halotydeus destructor]|nr:hypothetical protein HDE_09203 [Halotydeus destructor]